jgi:hypothetical protein
VPRGDYRGGGPSTIPPTESWKERAERLEAALMVSTMERADLEEQIAELQGRLDEIADLAAPDRTQADERNRLFIELMARVQSHHLPPGKLRDEFTKLLEGKTTDVQPTAEPEAG